MGAKISGLTPKGAALATTDLIEISQSAGGGLYTTRSVTGANIKALVTDANMTTTDITTNDVSTAKHGFAPKAPNDTAKFLRGDGTWAVPAGGGLTEFTELETTAAPNATVPVNSLTPVTATTNADFAIKPKGTGAILANIPDNTTTGGNKRGANAIDLSTYRTSADNVASGQYSVVIGQNSRASNTNAVALGSSAISTGGSAVAISGSTASGANSFSNGSRTVASGAGSVAFGSWIYADTTASGDNSIAMGGGNTASSSTSTAIGGEGNVSSSQGAVSLGGRNNTANGTHSYAFGAYTTTNGVEGRQSRGRTLGTVQGETQKSEFFLSIRTTGNTATTVTVAGGAAGTSNQVILSNNSAFRFKGTIIGKQSGSTNVAAWDVDGIIVRGANAAATTLSLGNVTLVQNTPAWGTPTLAADTTNGGLRVQVTGAAATNIQWTAVIETTEVIYA
jgi:hypothetical protein